MSAPPQMHPRAYQSEVAEIARTRNIICRMDTGTGKTFISIMLIRHISSLAVVGERKLIVFLCPTTDLVRQQGKTIRSQTNLRVKDFIGSDTRTSLKDPAAPPVLIEFWERDVWMEEFEGADVVVLTPAIWVNCLHHRYWTLDRVSLLIFDEGHHARNKHPYNVILQLFYHPLKGQGVELPRIFAMTASPIWNPKNPEKSIRELEANLDASIFEIKVNRDAVRLAAPRPDEHLVLFEPHTPSTLRTSFEESLAKLEPRVNLDLKTWKKVAHTRETLGTLACNVSLLQIIDTLIKSKKRQFGSDTVEAAPLASLKEQLSTHLIAESLTTKNTTPHIFALLDVLKKHHSLSNFHAIVFVQRRSHAQLLVDIVMRDISLREWLRPDWLVGHAGKLADGSLRGMSAKDQEKKVSDFASGKTNLLFATSVAEEGLDFQSCHVVVRFNFFPTIISYIQSRGRARRKDSDFYILAERHSDDEARYLKYHHGEPGLNKMYGEERDEEAAKDQDSDDEVDFNLPTTTVESGALLSHQRSIALLSETCALLPTDPFTPAQKPQFSYAQRSTTYDHLRSKAIAKQNAAYKACLVLYKAGGLDDFLLPPRVAAWEAGGVDADGMRVEPSEVPHEVTIRTKIPWGDFFSLESQLYLVVLSILDDGHESAVGFVSTSPIAEFTGSTLFADDPARQIQLRVLSRKPLELDSSDRQSKIKDLERLNNRAVQLLLNRRFTPADRLLFLWAPLCSNWSEIDWVLARNPFHKVSADNVPTRGTSIFVESRRVTSRETHFERIRSDVTLSSHTAEVENTTDSASYDRKTADRSPEYRIYAERVFGVLLAEDSANNAVLEVLTTSKCIPNLLVPSPPEEHHFTPQKAFYPAEICCTSSLPTSFFQFIRLSPSISRLIADTLHVHRVTADFELPHIDTSLMIQALTTPSAQTGYDYERLETLGDSILKLATTIHIYSTHPTYDEGRMSRLRSNSTDNHYLRHRSLQIKFCDAIISEPFRTTNWTPLDLKAGTLVEEGRYIKRTAGRRALSDTVEAILGAAYLTGGFPVALKTGDQLGLCFGGDRAWSTRAGFNTMEFDSSPTPANISLLQARLGYKFRASRMLIQALTHRSFKGAETHCYEREEHLGDAILDFWAVNYLFNRFPHATPGSLTFNRTLLVNNTTLAVLGISYLSVHRSILHSAPALEMAMKVAESELRNFGWTTSLAGEVVLDFGRLYNELVWVWDPPKIIGDVFEAIIGAIFVDSGFHLEEPFHALDRLFAPFVGALDGVEIRDPVTTLLTFTQSHHCEEGVTFKIVPMPGLDNAAQAYECTASLHENELCKKQGTFKVVCRQLAARHALEVQQQPGEEDLLHKFCSCEQLS
ncbi:hypothetical protein T439DRAFT_347998 [Meredithblackwellia eburnea MCA 4105]